MASSYKSEYPSNTAVDEGIIQFFETFYKLSDTPGAHDQYAESFTENAVLIMASKRSDGYAEILAMRKGMWDAVVSRHHRIFKIFPFGPNATELMLYGTVAYELKDGRKADVPWSARAVMAKEKEAWKLGFYQVYLDSMAVQNAK